MGFLQPDGHCDYLCCPTVPDCGPSKGANFHPSAPWSLPERSRWLTFGRGGLRPTGNKPDGFAYGVGRLVTCRRRKQRTRPKLNLTVAPRTAVPPPTRSGEKATPIYRGEKGLSNFRPAVRRSSGRDAMCNIPRSAKMVDDMAETTNRPY